MKLRHKRKQHNLPRLYRSLRVMLSRTFRKSLVNKQVSTDPIGIKFNFDPKARAEVKEILYRMILVEKKIENKTKNKTTR